MSTAQRAMRLLAVLLGGCEWLRRSGRDGEVAIFRGETRLNALMFWLRNPDYLAWELLELHAANGDARLVDQVRAMLADDEPVLRRDAMPKWRFGAYERIVTEMAVLASVGLVRTVARPGGIWNAENSFLIFQAAVDLRDRLADDPGYGWYADRMRVVMSVAGDQPGSTLKQRQYDHIEYASTRGHDPIPPITGRVVDRLQLMSGRG